MDLQRGMRDKLDKYLDLNNKIEVEMGISGPAVYDFCCFGVDAADQLSDDRYMVFFNQTSSPAGEISYRSSGSTANFDIELSRLPQSIQKLVFTVSIDGNSTMGQISGHTFFIKQNGNSVLNLNLRGTDFSQEKAIITVEIYRKDTWRINAIARGFNGGLGDLLRNYGGEEETDASAASPAPAAPTPASPSPVVQGPTNPGPMNQGMMNQGPAGPSPMNQGMMNQGPAGPSPMNQGMMNQGPAGPSPMNQGMMNQGPASPSPMNPGMMNQGPAGPSPMNPGMMNQGPASPSPMNPGMMNQGPAGPSPMNQGMMNQGPAGPGSMNQGMMNQGPASPSPMNQGMMNQGPKKVSLEKKLSERAPQLVSLAKPITEQLERHNIQDVVARVALVMDISGSMINRYTNGTVQEIVNHVLPLAVQFDDDGELDFWYYGSRPKRMESVNLGNYKNAVPQDWRKLMEKLGYGNNEPLVMDQVIHEYKKSKLPAYVIFVTDGGVGSADKIKKLLTTASKLPIFWQFVGVGGAGYGILEELDSMGGRYVDNANFFALDDFMTVPDNELYSRLLNEFPSWLRVVQSKGMI